MKKRKGSILLECIVSVFILTILFSIFVKMNKLDLTTFDLRGKFRENNIALNNVINEIKFNTTIDDLNKKFIDDRIIINLDEVKSLKDKDILDIVKYEESNDFIEVNKTYYGENSINMTLKLISEGEEVLNEEVIKECWMEGS